MLQIIGWLLCLCLFVKGMELASLPEGHGNDGTRAGAALSMLGAMAFAFWIYVQGNAVNQVTNDGPLAASSSINTDECMNPDINASSDTIACDKVRQ